ncbi:RsmB/NOP family class I SAM-dependent RNA methyltransferase [Pukyongiella litopenaei]|uniref:RsmB/NOP family class I SAM-dependent RNA methyltransferase n=1 Tax=Pukyongiella litopenaei TaxID=2605946 RepID=A0A2S0MPH2_9RHOB|nr:RsmB/NOP family class I SAM-dependent RNA methyltransferase [Pukyongiella litopenaei]AVO37764.1 RsmB/NOP family class I SAM-dependent RNA methyltransferase [Pukyongiella litopenaei]
MSDMGVDARRGAVALLDKVLGEGRMLSDVTESLDRLSGPDRARAQRLATDTLRGLERADRLLNKHLRKAPPLHVRNALRVGTVELCTGAAAHGVVNAMVQVVGRHRRHGQLKGLVNAVLRKIAAEGPEAWNKLRVPRLPKWLRGPLTQAWGPQAVTAMEAAHFAGAPLDLTAKPGIDLTQSLTGAESLPTGSLRLAQPGQISALPGYEAGDWWVQDAAAALPARILDAQPGESVLDLCAAPGGKTLQMAAAGADVVAVDISDRRLGRLRENLARTGLRADIRTGDALEMTGVYDAVLLDAPCSATGTIRRHPDLPHARDGAEICGLIALQARMLAHALTLLKPGGRLVYCTCSLLPDEGEVQVEEALAAHPGLVADRAALSRPGIDPAWITEEGGLRLRPDYWPERGGMDGFYIACLRRDG